MAEQNGFLDIFYDGGQMSALLGGRYGGDIGEMWGRYGGQMSALLGGRYAGDIGEMWGRYGGQMSALLGAG